MIVKNLNSTPTQQQVDEDRIWSILKEVYDPELPVLSIVDLGVVRDVIAEDISISPSGKRAVIITPTYSGCPAMDVIAMNIEMALHENGFSNVLVVTVLAPAWTTDWMTEIGKEKLKAYGIAPPVGKSFDTKYLDELKIECPQCHSNNTHLVSQFGSTPCKALFKCADCKEPFDYFKCH